MADASSHMTPGNGNTHEHSDANSGNLFKTAAALMALIVGSFIAMYVLLVVFEKNPPEATAPPSEVAQKTVLPPEPRLETRTGLLLESYRAEEDSILTTYGWVDRGSGLVRIPVESAIVRVAKQGLPFDTSLERRK